LCLAHIFKCTSLVWITIKIKELILLKILLIGQKLFQKKKVAYIFIYFLNVFTISTNATTKCLFKKKFIDLFLCTTWNLFLKGPKFLLIYYFYSSTLNIFILLACGISYALFQLGILSLEIPMEQVHTRQLSQRQVFTKDRMLDEYLFI